MARQGRSNFKRMLIIFFGSKGLLYKEFILPCQTVNQPFYIRFLKYLSRMSRGSAQTGGTLRKSFCIITLPAYILLSLQQFLTKNNMAVVPHPAVPLTYHSVPFPFLRDENPVKRMKI
jgi:hypothetical protein